MLEQGSSRCTKSRLPSTTPWHFSLHPLVPNSLPLLQTRNGAILDSLPWDGSSPERPSPPILYLPRLGKNLIRESSSYPNLSVRNRSRLLLDNLPQLMKKPAVQEMLIRTTSPISGIGLSALTDPQSYQYRPRQFLARQDQFITHARRARMTPPPVIPNGNSYGAGSTSNQIPNPRFRERFCGRQGLWVPTLRTLSQDTAL